MVGGGVEDWFREAIGLPFQELGRSSIEFMIRGSAGGEEKFRARHKVAMVSLESWRALPIPEDMRAKMRAYLQ